MPTKRIYTQDFYQTALTSEIAASWDVTFDVTTPPDNPQWWIIISPDNANLRERMYYYDVQGNTIYVRWTWRFWAKEHAIWETVKINDISNIFNYFSDISSSAFYIEQLSWTSVKVWWWDILKDNATVSIWDTTLNLPNDLTSYIYFCKTDNSVKYAASESAALNDAGVIVSDVTCSGWSVAWIVPRNYKFSTFTIEQWPPWEQWPAWNIVDAPEWQSQTVSENIILPDGATVEIIWETIKITLASWAYTIYSESDISTYDAEWALASKELRVWTFSTPLMAYSDWMTVNWVSWLISFVWNIAYRNESNTFTKNNTFQWQTIFEWAASFPYKILSSASGNFSFDNSLSDFQWITITGASDHICSLDNMVSWIKSLFVIQWSGWTGKLNFQVWTWNTITNTYILEDLEWNKSYDPTVALAEWVYFFTIAVATTWAHIMLSWKSVLNN